MVTIFLLYAIPTYRVEGKFHNHQIALEMGLADELQTPSFSLARESSAMDSW